MTLPCRSHVEEIARRYKGAPWVSEGLAGALAVIDLAWRGPGAFLMELMQNADDANSTELRVTVRERAFYVSNDGDGFSRDDVESICRVGMSKKRAEYIGYLGVGFKSVFRVSDRPHVLSGDYSFKFDKSHWGGAAGTPWQVMPVWVPERPTLPESHANAGTTFYVPLRRDTTDEWLDQLHEQLGPESLHSRVMLFLRNLRFVSLADDSKGLLREVEKSKESPDHLEPDGCTLWRLEDDYAGHSKEITYWAVFSGKVEVPDWVRADPLTETWRRAVQRREVAVAFRLDEDLGLVPEREGTVYTGVFSFLPLKEEAASGLPFLIQGDFLTPPGRDSIERDARWNKWVADEVYILLRDKVVPSLKADDRWRLNFTEVLYPTEANHPVFDAHVRTPLRELLDREPVLLDLHGEWVPKDRAAELPRQAWERFSRDEIERLCGEKRPLLPACRTPPSMGVERPMRTAENLFKLPALTQVLDARLQRGDAKWFMELASFLCSLPDVLLHRDKPFLLTRKFTLASLDTLRVPAADLLEDPNVAPQIEREFDLLHPDVQAFMTENGLIGRLGIRTLTSDDVERHFLDQELPRISEEWDELEEDQRATYIARLARRHAREALSPSRLGFLTIKSADGPWLRPAEMLLTEHLDDSHRLQALLDHGLLADHEIPFPFACGDFMATCASRGQQAHIVRLLKDLGVGKPVREDTPKRRQLVDTIAMNCAKRFVQQKGQHPEQPSAHGAGYDLAWSGESGRSFVEVKGSTAPGAELRLTMNELRFLMDHPSDSYIYHVSDALRRPTLRALKGGSLLGLDSAREWPYAEWQQLVDETKEFL